MKTLKELRAELKKQNDALPGLKAKARAEKATADDKTAYKTALEALDALCSEIDEKEAEEKTEARASKAAGSAADGTGSNDQEESEGDFAWARVKGSQKDAAEFEVTILAAAHAVAKSRHASGETVDTVKVLREEGYDRFADDMLRRQAQRAKREGRVQKTNSTLTPQDGGILLPTPNSGTIIPFLRNENTFINNGPVRIPLVGGRYNQPRGATTSTAGYVGEGAKKPVGSPTFDGINMSSKKIAGIVMLTEEVLRWSLADIRGYVENDLRESIAENMDLALYFGAGSATVPAGILTRDSQINIFDASASGAGAFFSNPKAPTYQEIDRIGTLMMLAITDRRISPRNLKWTMNYHLIEYMRNLRGANGQFIFENAQSDNPTWKGFAIRPTNAFPNNGGTATDESTLALIDWGSVLYGEDQDLTVKTSTEATIDTGTGTLVHLFQQNMMAILMEARHDVALRRAGAISVLRKARWGSLAA